MPKPFEGEFAVLQRNAIQSWRLLHRDCEVILFGTEEGVAEIAAELRLRHVPEVGRNEYGTPLVNDMFEKAQQLARRPIVCYVNADVILMRNFVEALQRIHRPKFLMIGQRWNVRWSQHIDLADPDWQEQLAAFVQANGALYSPTGIDYFAYPRGLYTGIPPFAIGRYAWDNWLVYRARVLGATVYDATRVVMAVHQDHSYFSTQVRTAAEAKRNLELAQMVGDEMHQFTVHDATWIVDQRGVRRALDRRYLWRRLMALTVLYAPLHPVYTIAKKMRNWLETRRAGR